MHHLHYDVTAMARQIVRQGLLLTQETWQSLAIARHRRIQQLVRAEVLTIAGWWCPTCQRWKARADVQQTERDEVCVEVCTVCGAICEDRRFATTDEPSC